MVAGRKPTVSLSIDIRQGEQISGSEFRRRLNRNGIPTSTKDIRHLTRSGVLRRDAEGYFVWPHCADDLADIKGDRSIAPQMPNLDESIKRRSPNAVERIDRGSKKVDHDDQPNDDYEQRIKLNIADDDLKLPKIVLQLINDLNQLKDSALSGTHAYAKTFNELIKARSAQTEMLVRDGELIERAGVEEAAKMSGQHQRNIWMNLPERIAVEFAEEAGIDRRLAYDLLMKHIHATLLMISQETGEQYDKK